MLIYQFFLKYISFSVTIACQEFIFQTEADLHLQPKTGLPSFQENIDTPIKGRERFVSAFTLKHVDVCWWS